MLNRLRSTILEIERLKLELQACRGGLDDELISVEVEKICSRQPNERYADTLKRCVVLAKKGEPMPWEPMG